MVLEAEGLGAELSAECRAGGLLMMEWRFIPA